jgi:hypothetical protein
MGPQLEPTEPLSGTEIPSVMGLPLALLPDDAVEELALPELDPHAARSTPAATTAALVAQPNLDRGRRLLAR